MLESNVNGEERRIGAESLAVTAETETVENVGCSFDIMDMSAFVGSSVELRLGSELSCKTVSRELPG